jgi:hypothetical protein
LTAQCLRLVWAAYEYAHIIFSFDAVLTAQRSTASITKNVHCFNQPHVQHHYKCLLPTFFNQLQVFDELA